MADLAAIQRLRRDLTAAVESVLGKGWNRITK